MTKVIHKSYIQNDSLLFPPCLGDLIPENHQVRIVSAIIDNLDISSIEKGYKGGGTSSYNPRMLLKIIIYAYLCNIYSGRQMAKIINENIYFMWLSGMSHPDFRTINIFRSTRLKGVFDELFTQVVTLLADEDLVSLKIQYIDGTKIESVANKYTFVWRGSVEKNKAKLETKIKSVLEEAQSVLEEENASIDDSELTPKEVKEKADRILSKMDEKGISDKKLRKKVKEVKEEMASRLEKYDDQLDILEDRNSYSKTDEDATFMKMKEDAMNNGQTKPGYNIQIATENQFILNYELYWRPTDYGTLIPFLESFKNKFNRQSDVVVADSGYGSEQNYQYMQEEGIEAFVKYNMFHAEQKRKIKNNPFLVQNMFYNKEKDFYVCPMGQHLVFSHTVKSKSELYFESIRSVYISNNCSGCPLRGMCYKSKYDRRKIEVNHNNDMLRAQAREKLCSEEGLYHRSMRPIEPEAVFGNIKFNHGFRRFKLKSIEKVSVEFGLVALAHNLRKYVKIINNRIANAAKTAIVEQNNYYIHKYAA